jgi:hypothetical protein
MVRPLKNVFGRVSRLIFPFLKRRDEFAEDAEV